MLIGRASTDPGTRRLNAQTAARTATFRMGGIITAKTVLTVLGVLRVLKVRC